MCIRDRYIISPRKWVDVSTSSGILRYFSEQNYDLKTHSLFQCYLKILNASAHFWLKNLTHFCLSCGCDLILLHIQNSLPFIIVLPSLDYKIQCLSMCICASMHMLARAHTHTCSKGKHSYLHLKYVHYYLIKFMIQIMLLHDPRICIWIYLLNNSFWQTLYIYDLSTIQTKL